MPRSAHDKDRRRPQEHTRVINGKVVPVNSGVHYKDEVGGGRPGSVQGLLDGDGISFVDTYGGDDLWFLPEDMRSLPGDPRDVFAPTTLNVACCGGEHAAVLSSDSFELLDHDLTDEIVAALGGGQPECMRLRDALKKPVRVSLNVGYDEVKVFVTDDNPVVEDVPVEGHGDPYGVIRDITARSGRAGAVQQVARAAADGWLQSFGASPTVGKRGLVYINKENGDENSRFVGEVSPAGVRPVSMFGVWGDGAYTRFVMNVNEDWYDDVRENGYLVQGRLNLGTNDVGRVVADVDPETGEVFARNLYEGEVLPPIEEAVMAAAEIQERHHRALRAANRTGFVVGSFAVLEDDGEGNQWASGSVPHSYFGDPVDADLWSRYKNVTETMFLNGSYPEDYLRLHSRLPSDFPEGGSIFDLMNAAAHEAVNPSVFAPPFTEWKSVTKNDS